MGWGCASRGLRVILESVCSTCFGGLRGTKLGLRRRFFLEWVGPGGRTDSSGGRLAA